MAAEGSQSQTQTEGSASSLRYNDKVAIVTGGSRGIGEGVVRMFVRHGAKVAFCANEREYGPKLEKELNTGGPGESFFIFCDCTKEEDVKRLIEETVKKYGRIDCLVNNAGTHPDYVPIDQFSSESFRWLFELNTMGYFLAAKYALPHLRKVKGNIINTSSLVANIGQRHAVTYVSTKGAITAMTKALAIDEAKYHVRVNSISPSSVLTPLWWHGLKDMTEEDQKKAIQGGCDQQVLGRMGTLEEVGLAYLFLAADATFCTGIDLPLSGGSELNYGIKTEVRDRGRYQ